MATPSRYIVYRTAATSDSPAGTVVNAVIWDGTAPYNPGTGLALAADPDSTYAVGSTYVVPAAAS